MYSGDFVKLTAALNGVKGTDAEEKAGPETWTDAETLLLLEGIELYDDDWVSIAEHVGSKSREACVLKFLQLPIEDGYDDEGLTNGQGGTAVGANGVKREGDLGLLRYSKIPFDKTDNPVLSVAAFLAGVKGAETAKAKERASGAPEVKSEAMEIEETNVSGDGAKAASSSALKDSLSLPPTSRTAHLAMHHTAQSAAQLGSESDTQLREALTKLVGAQIRKMELKMAQFEEMEEALEEERRGVEALRLSMLSERAQVRRWLEKIGSQMGNNMNPNVHALMAEGASLLSSGSSGRLQVLPVDTSNSMEVGEPGGPIPEANYGTLV
jgi:SWI/SNF related-matrix-associated actin-dependent regulator of chromatin subfamily C